MVAIRRLLTGLEPTQLVRLTGHGVDGVKFQPER
jgi:hypothetical protein